MKYVLVSYNNDPTWVKEYTDDWLIYDRSEKPFDFPNTIHTQNVGNVDYDKLSYLIDNYDDLPDVFVWGKTNLFQFITKEEFDKVKDNTEFTPLLTQNHTPKMPDAYYKDGMYYEQSTMLAGGAPCYFNKYGEFAWYLGLPYVEYVPFPPGGNFILTRETVLRYSKEFYERMRDLLKYSQLPIEAHFCERAYYTLWK